MQLNHINLSVSDVASISSFFVRCFDFRVTAQRGNGKFAVLKGTDNFILVLMQAKDATHHTYPPMFHVGFLLSNEAAVRTAHERIVAAGHHASAPQILERGGGPTFGFYYAVPGGVLLEVSTPAIIGFLAAS